MTSALCEQARLARPTHLTPDGSLNKVERVARSVAVSMRRFPGRTQETSGGGHEMCVLDPRLRARMPMRDRSVVDGYLHGL
jgi:hypothetical protein